MNFGNKVRLVRNINGNVFEEIIRNVTEIHYNYKTVEKEPRVAIESDIHSTGFTFKVSELVELETFLEDSIVNEH